MLLCNVSIDERGYSQTVRGQTPFKQHRLSFTDFFSQNTKNYDIATTTKSNTCTRAGVYYECDLITLFVPR